MRTFDPGTGLVLLYREKNSKVFPAIFTEIFIGRHKVSLLVIEVL